MRLAPMGATVFNLVKNTEHPRGLVIRLPYPVGYFRAEVVAVVLANPAAPKLLEEIRDCSPHADFINMGKPAARVGDMHVCPMVTAKVPHVGGPINPPGFPVVLIGGLAAARVGDICTCVGPPDVIVTGSSGVIIGGIPAARADDSTAHGGKIVAGCTSVLIGESGGGGGGGGGGYKEMGTKVLKKVLQKLAGHLSEEKKKEIGQMIAQKEAAEKGTPFVEEC